MPTTGKESKAATRARTQQEIQHELSTQSGPSRKSSFPAIPAAEEWFFIQRPSSTIKVQKGGGTETNFITPTKVCAKQTLVDDNDNSLHALFHNQPNFKAAQIVNALSE